MGQAKQPQRRHPTQGMTSPDIGATPVPPRLAAKWNTILKREGLGTIQGPELVQRSRKKRR